MATTSKPDDTNDEPDEPAPGDGDGASASAPVPKGRADGSKRPASPIAVAPPRSAEERALAFENIRQAAQFFGVAMQETDWRQLGQRPRAGRSAEDRRLSARKAADTRKRNARRPPPDA